MTADSALHITDDADADALLTRDPLALLIGMLLQAAYFSDRLDVPSATGSRGEPLSAAAQ